MRKSFRLPSLRSLAAMVGFTNRMKESRRIFAWAGNYAHGRRRFGRRWQSAAATPFFVRTPASESGVARRFPPQSKNDGPARVTNPQADGERFRWTRDVAGVWGGMAAARLRAMEVWG